MRTFTDATGRSWDVVAGRESWGAIFAIFIPRKESGEIRQTPLDAASYGEATVELDALSEEDLRAMLDRSDPKSTD